MENARKMPRHHPRCGTSFLLVVMVISILVFSIASSALLALCLWLVLTTGSGLFLLLGALWLAYRSLPPEVFLPRRLAKPTKNR